MFRALLGTGITGVGTDYVFLAVQKLIDLGSISHVGYRADYAVQQTRLVIHADVRPHAEVILVALLGLAHFWIALPSLFLVREEPKKSQYIQPSPIQMTSQTEKVCKDQ